MFLDKGLNVAMKAEQGSRSMAQTTGKKDIEWQIAYTVASKRIKIHTGTHVLVYECPMFENARQIGGTGWSPASEEREIVEG